MKKTILFMLLLCSLSHAYLEEGFGDLFSAFRSAFSSPKKELKPLAQQKNESGIYNYNAEKRKHYVSSRETKSATKKENYGCTDFKKLHNEKRTWLRLFLCGE